MAKQLQLRRGTTAQHSTFTGAVGEVTIDTDKDVVVVHDGSTAGGKAMVKEADTAYTIATVNDFGTVPVGYTTVIVTDTDRGGIFVWSASGTANGGTVFAGATGYWNRQYDGAVNVKWFGASTSKTNNNVYIQKALSVSKSIALPPEELVIDAPIVLTDNIYQIVGIKGKTILMGKSGVDIEGYFRVEADFVADFGNIYGITFDAQNALNNKIAIYSSSEHYLIHTKIEECNFNGRLTTAIEANLIACHIYRCYFGVYYSGFSANNTMVAIKSVGTLSPIRTSNINIIEQCEFSRMGTPNYNIEFSIGVKLIFRDCIFEKLNPNISVIKIKSISNPVFTGCWFEDAYGKGVNNARSYIEFEEDLVNIPICIELIKITSCLFQTFGNEPDGIINLGNSVRKTIEFNGNFMPSLKSPIILGGNANAKFINSFGNSATVKTGGDATDLQYNSFALFGLGVKTPVVVSNNINFPEPQVSSSNPNTLDAYQESNWAITDGSGAGLALTVRGKYTKIGNVVTYVAEITYPVTADVSGARITQPPVGAYNTAFPSSVFSDSGLSIQALGDGMYIKFYKNNTLTGVTNAELSGKRLFISGTYISKL